MINFHHPLEDVARMLSLLTLSEFHWTPQDVLAIPSAWADDILTAQYCGGIVKAQTRKKD